MSEETDGETAKVTAKTDSNDVGGACRPWIIPTVKSKMRTRSRMARDDQRRWNRQQQTKTWDVCGLEDADEVGRRDRIEDVEENAEEIGSDSEATRDLNDVMPVAPRYRRSRRRVEVEDGEDDWRRWNRQ
jgi:hypothetical protein